MSFSYDPTTDVGFVRLVAGDNVTPGEAFSDEEIGAFLTLNDGGVLYAAASALETRATRMMVALRAGKIKLPDLEVDATLVYKGLMDQVAALRAQADGDASFAVAEQVVDAFSARERYWKELQRQGVV
jgi:hypothetical protein